MWSIGQIAERDGISKQAVAKTVSKLITEHGIPVTRDTRGRVALLSLAHYDHHRGFFSNSAKLVAPVVEKGATSPAIGNEQSRDEALRQQAWLALDRERIKHKVEALELVRADKQAEALKMAGRAIQAEVSRLHIRADDVAIAVSKEGVHGARMLLRKISVEINTKIADALDRLVASAPEHDVAIEDVEP
jgi:hypothetical protein